MSKSTSKKPKKATPLMAQFNRIKSKYPDALLLFRVGDFYETFGEDAIKASRVLNIVLTKRNNGAAGKIELAGFPHHSLDTYLPKLVKAGLRVAICDQLEDPKKTKTLVKRGVTEVVTPGVILKDNILEQKRNNFLAAVSIEKSNVGLAFVDLSTGEFLCAQGSEEYGRKLLSSLQPSELLYSKSENNKSWLKEAPSTYGLEPWIMDDDYCKQKLKDQFETSSLKGFGIEKMPLGIKSAGALLHYLEDTAHHQRAHINSINRIDEDGYVWLDKFSIRNLELLDSQHPNGVSLFNVIDKTASAMGGRLLRRYIILPLKNRIAIERRLSIVDEILSNSELRGVLQDQLKGIGDLERMISRIASGKSHPRELIQLKHTIEAFEPIKTSCSDSKNKDLLQLGVGIDLCSELYTHLHLQLKEDCAAVLGKGPVFNENCNKELDELRQLSKSGKDILVDIQKREIENTGITSLKIGFNNVFGYYLEVTNRFKEQVPEQWIRKQTLTNSERYITEELKTLEEKILTAEQRIHVIESELFEQLINYLQDFILQLQSNAKLLAELDVFQCFASISEENGYVRPEINESLVLDIKGGRHPVIEKGLPIGESYVPNDLYLDNTSQQMIIITGPNMSGKSAVLRQTALIVLMAQIGCFVPATEAKIGFVDKIFTRVGASDNLSLGESTFMVEMLETASIMNNISERSLILLDEIGRGTSTYDGISIAWSLAEYLHENNKCRPKTLFATHYHELNELSKQYDRIANYHVATKEVGEKVIFLRTLTKGGSEHSFGIHVAQMAGMPKWIINRANDILKELEQKNVGTSTGIPSKTDEFQLSIFDVADPETKAILDELDDIDINELTPMQAMLKLDELKKKRKK